MNKFALALLSAGLAFTSPALADDPAELNDLQIAHVAYTADNIDIAYAKLALEKSGNEDVRKFAETMVRDHEAVNEAALGLLDKLGVQAEDNFLSQSLSDNAEKITAELSALDGAEFDKAYAENELAYHKAVNELVEKTFIPNIENEEVRALFEEGLRIFKTHEDHAEMMVEALQ
ncbi:MAG: DUF4142 domain-containing protein [Geminicoccaceae bacterium]